MDHTTTKRICLFSHPRTRCNLLFRLLSSHPSFNIIGPFNFLRPYFIGEDYQSPAAREAVALTADISMEEASGISYQQALDDMQRAILKAEAKGRVPVTMEHPYMVMDSSVVNRHLNLTNVVRRSPSIVDRMLDRMLDTSVKPSGSTGESPPLYSNPTLLPDRFYYTFAPVIVIRHPACVLPSYLRIAGASMGTTIDSEDFLLLASFRCERLVFDSFRTTDNDAPIVVDGEKLVKDPYGQMKKLCNALGVDDSQINYTWEAAPEGQIIGSLGPITTTFFKRLSQSTGVIPDSRFTTPLNLHEEVRKWAREWNDDIARKLEKYVLAAMEDYEYLHQFSL